MTSMIPDNGHLPASGLGGRAITIVALGIALSGGIIALVLPLLASLWQ